MMDEARKFYFSKAFNDFEAGNRCKSTMQLWTVIDKKIYRELNPFRNYLKGT